MVLGLSPTRGGAGGDGELHADAVPVDQRRLALAMAMEEGADASDFDVLARHLAQARDPELRNQLLAAASDVKDPALRARARAMALTPGALRRNEIEWLLPKERDDAAARAAGREWLDANFDAIARITSPRGARLVFHYAQGMCSAEEADTLQAKFSERLRELEGGPRSLAQAVENVQLCAALVARQRGAEP